MDEKEKPKEGVGTDLVAGATGATVGLATLTLLTPAVGVEPAAVAAGAMSGATSHLTKRVLSFVADAWNKRTGRKTQKLIESVAKIQSKSADDVAEELIPIIDDDSASEPVWRTVRAAIETPDDAAITPLATLLNMYRGQNPPKTVDVFFRGMTRMLSECDAEGLADLRAAVAASRLDSGEFPPRTIVTADRERLGGPLTVASGEKKVGKDIAVGSVRADRLRTARLELGTTGEGKRPVEGLTYGRAVLVVQRLGAVGIGTPRTETGVESVSVPNAIMERLATILGAETPTT
jgi:hypothetical protein